MTSGGCKVDVCGGEYPSTNSCAVNNRVSFLPAVKYCQSCEHLGSWLTLEDLMMRSSMLIKHRPLPPTSTSRSPDVIHVLGAPRASLFLLFFRSLYHTEHKNGGGLGMSLPDSSIRQHGEARSLKNMLTFICTWACPREKHRSPVTVLGTLFSLPSSPSIRT